MAFQLRPAALEGGQCRVVKVFTCTICLCLNLIAFYKSPSLQLSQRLLLELLCAGIQHCCWLVLLGAGCHGHASGREKEESSPFNEIAVVGRAIVFFSPYFIISLIFYLRMIWMFFSANVVLLVLEAPTLCTCVHMFIFVQIQVRSLISRFMKERFGTNIPLLFT